MQLLGALVITGMLTASAAAAETSNQFNLVCDGSAHNVEDGKQVGPTEPWFNIYRVDLDHDLWCAGLCNSSPSKIEDVSTDEIVFKVTEEKFISQIIRVNRLTGKLEALMTFHGTQRDSTLAIMAQCKRSNFSKFPERLF